jgi:hypothetical protein
MSMYRSSKIDTYTATAARRYIQPNILCDSMRMRMRVSFDDGVRLVLGSQRDRVEPGLFTALGAMDGQMWLGYVGTVFLFLFYFTFRQLIVVYK